MKVVRNELSATGQLKLLDAFLDRAAGNSEEVFSIRLCETTVALGNVGRDRKWCRQDCCNEPETARFDRKPGRRS